MEQITFGRCFDIPLAVSPDEKNVFFIRENWKGRVALPQFEIWRAPFAEKETQPVLIGRGASITPTGTQRVISSTDSASPTPVIVLQAQEGQSRPIGQGYSPTISPDGSKIAFVGGPQFGQDAIILLSIDTRTPTTIDNSPGIKSPPRFSLAGDEIAWRVFSGNLEETSVTILSLTEGPKERIPFPKQAIRNLLRETPIVIPFRTTDR